MRSLSGVLILAGTVALGGCYGYGSYPRIPTATPQNSDPNAPPGPALMQTGLDWITSRYPPRTTGMVVVGEPTFAINLPVGVTPETYERVATRLSDHARPLMRSLPPSLPIYHVGRVWIRGATATVDVLRPVPELGLGPDGRPVYRGATLHFESRFEPWRVTRAVEWEIGTLPTPDLNYMPEPEGDSGEGAPGAEEPGAAAGSLESATSVVQ